MLICIDLDILKLFFQRLVLVLETLQVSLLLLQRLSELATPLFEIFHFLGEFRLLFHDFDSQFLDLRVLLLRLCAQTHSQFLHGSHLLLNLDNLSLFHRLLHLCLAELFGHFGSLFLVNGHLFL